ncbi:uracil DNA glycosylase [Onygenales sp. PD_40]|nr:uracil DNA glycosylase [Onygenales sp. PD_40]
MSTSQENPEPAEKTGRRVTYHPSHLLAEVGKSINTILPDLKVSTPYSTTWQGCLKTVSDSLSGVEDRHITIDSPIPTLRKRALRDELLRTIQASQQDSLLTTKPIRLQYDASQVPLPTPLSRQAKERVKELAGPLLPCEEPYPVTTIQAAVGLGALPTIPAKLILEGVDDDSKQEKMENAVMLFDTGARQTILTDDMLSPEFRDYLHNDPVHDPYRVGADGGCWVQLCANIGFTNKFICLCTIALVIRKSTVPDSRSGIIFGQKGCLDSICYRSVPAKFLKAQDDHVWGDITIDQYIGPDGKTAAC